MTAPRGSGGAGASEAEAEAGARALARLQIERNMSGDQQRDAAFVERCIEHAWRDWTEEAWRVLEARPASAGEASEVERLRAQRDAAQLDAILWTGRAEMQEERASAAEAENGRLRTMLAASDAPCPHCGLAAADMAKCARGLPGCARADDMRFDDPPVAPNQAEVDRSGDDPIPEFGAAKPGHAPEPDTGVGDV